ncbi:MAG: IS3 family transposase [Acidobacteriota bacterium]
MAVLEPFPGQQESPAPDPEVPEKAKRRRYSARYKQRILKEADQCEPGQVGALLRREGLYWSNLQTWRRQREEGTLAALTPKKRGRKAAPKNPLTGRVKELERENRQLRRKLQRAQIMLEIQKKGLRAVGDSPGATRERERRGRLMEAAEQFSSRIGTQPACGALGVSRASLYRRRQASRYPQLVKRRPPAARALSSGERQAVLQTLHCERFVDQAPAPIWATLLDEGRYLCSIRSMYRILAEQGEVRERRRQLRHPRTSRPELLATGPNELWSWDITKLKGPVKWTYFYLYVILDVFSRYVVGWMVAHRERAALAQKLIATSCQKQHIEPGQLTVHADRGSSMTSKPVALLLSDLGVTKTHTRPYTSNDNPFSESQFKTLKYRPEFPQRFGSIEDARAFCRSFFRWYNQKHRHSGIALLTPEVVHYGLAKQVTQQRQDLLWAAYQDHPERFVKGPPKPPALPQAVWINPPLEDSKASENYTKLENKVSQSC